MQQEIENAYRIRELILDLNIIGSSWTVIFDIQRIHQAIATQDRRDGLPAYLDRGIRVRRLIDREIIFIGYRRMNNFYGVGDDIPFVKRITPAEF